MKTREELENEVKRLTEANERLTREQDHDEETLSKIDAAAWEHFKSIGTSRHAFDALGDAALALPDEVKRLMEENARLRIAAGETEGK